MSTSVIATTFILAVLFAILSSLVFGLFYLLSSNHHPARTATSLSVRVGLSMLLFLLLLFAIAQGWITPNPPPLYGL